MVASHAQGLEAPQVEAPLLTKADSLASCNQPRCTCTSIFLVPTARNQSAC